MSGGKVDGKGQAKILTLSEVEQIINYAREPYRMAIAICAFTGCRMSEAIALKRENILTYTITFTVTKTGKTRSVPLHPKLKALLDEANLPSSGYLFPSKGGKVFGHITRQAVDKELRALCDELGIQGVGTHSFRRTALTMMKDAGIPLKDIAAISGHVSLNELARYLDVSESNKQAAIAALSF